VRGVLLDIDGTLIDSNDAHAMAWVQALEDAGFSAPFERVRGLIGMGGDKLLPELTKLEKSSKRGTELTEKRSEIFRKEYLPRIRMIPGARALVERMKAEGLQVVAATSSSPEELTRLLALAEVDDLVDDATTAGDVDHSKPDPDILRAALQKMNVPPHEAVMIGDTPYDIVAAKRAHVASIAFRCGGWSDADLDGADAIYDGPAQLLSRYEDSMLARPARETPTRQIFVRRRPGAAPLSVTPRADRPAYGPARRNHHLRLS
jgi:HAD superfamily hydrolase (TIGR01509 family)